MAKPFVVNQEGMRILIDPDDPDRVPKKMVEYKLSPEEIEKRYGHIKSTGRAKPIVPGDMKEYWKRKEEVRKEEVRKEEVRKEQEKKGERI
jgi:hypothetical protein